MRIKKKGSPCILIICMSTKLCKQDPLFTLRVPIKRAAEQSFLQGNPIFLEGPCFVLQGSRRSWEGQAGQRGLLEELPEGKIRKEPGLGWGQGKPGEVLSPALPSL